MAVNPLAARVAIAGPWRWCVTEQAFGEGFRNGYLFRSEMEKIDNPMIRQVREKDF